MLMLPFQTSDERRGRAPRSLTVVSPRSLSPPQTSSAPPYAAVPRAMRIRASSALDHASWQRCSARARSRSWWTPPSLTVHVSRLIPALYLSLSPLVLLTSAVLFCVATNPAPQVVPVGMLLRPNDRNPRWPPDQKISRGRATQQRQAHRPHLLHWRTTIPCTTHCSHRKHSPHE